MKAHFEFSLPEENEEYIMHVKAGDFRMAIWDFSQWLRNICKHENPNDYNAEKVREKFFECLREYDVDL